MTFAALAMVMSGCGAKVSLVNPDEIKEEASNQTAASDESNTTDSASEKEPRQTAGVMLLNNINTIHPNKVQDSNAASAVNMAGEGLYRQNKDGKYELGLLAEKPEQVNEHTYRLKLRTDAKWSDGTPVVAKDLVLSWQALVDPSHDNAHGDLLNGVVKGATEIQVGKQDAKMLGVVAKDDHTLEVTFEQAIDQYDTLEALFARCELFPLPSDKIQSEADYASYGENANTTLSNGPYVIKNWQKGGWNSWQLLRNPYCDKQADYPMEQIEMHVATDPQMVQTNFKNQLVDMVPTLNNQTQDQAWNETRYLAFNVSDQKDESQKDKQKQNVVNNEELRALLLAPLNLTDAIQKTGQTSRVADDLVPMSQDSTAKNKQTEVSAEKLNKILDDYGYEALELSLLLQKEDEELAKTIKAQIEKAYPRVVIDVVPMTNESLINRQMGIVDYRDARYAEHYDMVIANHVQADSTDQYSLYQSFGSQSPSNRLGIHSDKIDEVLSHYNSGKSEMSQDDRQTIEQTLRDQSLVLPLYDTATTFTQSKAVKGNLSTKASELYDFNGVKFTSGEYTIPKVNLEEEASSQS
ncbi:MAG: ABC transporter substrate-binding protein [Aerococcus sp.]|nr:ABC transporter substrate-binding protein [Aerococcus sp.]